MYAGAFLNRGPEVELGSGCCNEGGKGYGVSEPAESLLITLTG
jgi:hypothetical protein